MLVVGLAERAAFRMCFGERVNRLSAIDWMWRVKESGQPCH